MEVLNKIIDALTRFFTWWIIVNPWEQGLRVRMGKQVKKLGPGFYFKFPLFDSAYVQSVRIRVIPLHPQTVSTRDGKTLTISMAVGFSIHNLETLYNTLNNPEPTLSNICMGAVATYISDNDFSDVTPEKIQNDVLKTIESSDYGLKFEYIKITGYAFVRTYRLIQDSQWFQDNFDMNKKS